jgi:hypothetical protein
MIAGLLRGLAPAQQQALLTELGIAPQDAPGRSGDARLDFGDEQLLSPAERYVRDEVAPALGAVRSLPRFQQEAAGVFQQHALFINELLFTNALLQEQVQALMQHADLALPEVDRKEIDAAVRHGKNYQEAVRAVYTPKARKAVDVKRAAGRPTPSTPRDSGSTPKPLPENASFYQIWKAAEREMAANGRK